MTGPLPPEAPAVTSWIWTENLHPWLQILGRICSYGLDDLDWAMIDLELEATDPENDRWFDVRLAGDETIAVSIADADDTHMTVVRVWCPDQLQSLVRLATDIASEYRIR